MNALLDYGSSCSSDSDEESLDKPTVDKPKLPKPTLGENALHTSVFSNPFVAEEMAKAAILEKHVKMIVHTIVKYIGNDCKVPGKNNMQVINGKKVCWNYRKGRCRFGHNCKYAHDSDIQKTPEDLEADKLKLKSVFCEGSSTVNAASPPEVFIEEKLPTDDEFWEGGSERKKFRPGLSKTLVPGKKVLQFYKDQKKKEVYKNKPK